MKMTTLALTAIPFVIAGTSYAAIEQYTVTGELNGVASNTSGTILFDAFDTTKGTLTGVTWRAEISALNGQITVRNDGSSQSTFIIALKNYVTLSPDATLDNDDDVLKILNQSTGNIVIAGNSQGSSALSLASSNIATQTDTDLIRYLVTGQVAFTYSSETSYSATIDGQSSNIIPGGIIDDPLNIKLYITYTYEAVPVPEATSLGLLSVAAFGLMMRRQK